MEMISPINSLCNVSKAKMGKAASELSDRVGKKRSINSIEDEEEAHQRHREEDELTSEMNNSKFENVTHSENDEDDDEEDDEEEEDEGEDEDEDEDESAEQDSSNRHTSNSDSSNSVSSPRNGRNNYAWANNENEYHHMNGYEYGSMQQQQQQQVSAQDAKYKWAGSKVSSNLGGGGASGKHKKGMPLPGSLNFCVLFVGIFESVKIKKKKKKGTRANYFELSRLIKL